MARGCRPIDCPLQIGIDDQGVCALGCIIEIEPGVEQPFIKKPETPRIRTGRRCMHDLDKWPWPSSLKQGFKDGQVQTFVT